MPIKAPGHKRWDIVQDKRFNRIGVQSFRKKDLIVALDKGVHKKGSLALSCFMDKQLLSGPVKRYTPEEIAEYERQLKERQ